MTTRRTPKRSADLGNRRTPGAQSHRDVGVRPYEGSVRLIQSSTATDSELPSSPRVQPAPAVLRPPAWRPSRRQGRRQRDPDAAPRGQPPRIRSRWRRRMLQVAPARAVVIEDAIAGVQAELSGHFGLLSELRAGRAMPRKSSVPWCAPGGERSGRTGRLTSLACCRGKNSAMIRHERLRPPSRDYPADEWSVVEKAFHPEFLAQLETMLAVANGYLGLRGGFPRKAGLHFFFHGTFVNGFYETWPIPYGEKAFGFAQDRPDDGQRARTARSCGSTSTTSRSRWTAANLLDYERRPRHEVRALDEREVVWETASGQTGPHQVASAGVV